MRIQAGGKIKERDYGSYGVVVIDADMRVGVVVCVALRGTGKRENKF